MNPNVPSPVPVFARLLGFAGLIPQGLVLMGLVLGGPDIRFAALSLGFAYAALIFSFLGGVWWGLAAAAPAPRPGWVWVAAVLPSLLALGSAWPWATGQTWPGPSLVILGMLIISSVLVDLKLASLGMTPSGWMSLRLPLSLGLGAMTLLAGLL